MNFYFEAAKTLDRLDAKEGSIKGVLATLPETNRKRTAALVIETLKYKSVLSDVIVRTKLLNEERKITSMNLALVLVHDLLLSNGIQAGDGPIKQAVLRHKTRLNGEFQKVKIKRGASSNVALAQKGDERAAQIPRYVRVNTNLWSVEDAIKAFQDQGFELNDVLDLTKGVSRDLHVPDLFLFPPGTAFQDNIFYKSGNIILQDKASCFPAVVLSPPATSDSVVIDATAAPGNKTTHLCALMRNRGKLYAFERDKRRFSTLKHMLSKAKCQNVEPVNADFLTIDPMDPSSFLLLDPSCSGSGIVNRLDYLLDTEEENLVDKGDRLNKLSAFQLMMVKHAMKFPNVQKIVYSTCSIHAIENEHVVREALNSDEARTGSFTLAPRCEVLPTWQRRGLSEELQNPDDGDSLIRCMPGEDATNGFFVSCFVRCRGSSLKRKDTDGMDKSSERPPKTKKTRKK
ncbi:S-adenosyl-L-methionine-dependent methyltransferase [Cyathus striatus]|nr:S-adenosyl-L-methionine-dependent methyltransferase [Cyathus striatus]